MMTTGGSELCDVRALLLHRHQWVRIRTRVMNALQGIALAHGIRRGAGLWSRDGQATVASLPLPPHAGYRRAELQALYVHLHTQIDEFDRRVSTQARERPQACRLMTHPGVGPVTALATEVFLGELSPLDAKILQYAYEQVLKTGRHATHVHWKDAIQAAGVIFPPSYPKAETGVLAADDPVLAATAHNSTRLELVTGSLNEYYLLNHEVIKRNCST